jgi:hypothetical protein
MMFYHSQLITSAYYKIGRGHRHAWRWIDTIKGESNEFKKTTSEGSMCERKRTCLLGNENRDSSCLVNGPTWA